MKVLVPGRPQKGWAKECTCKGAEGGGCGATLLVEEDDIRTTSSMDLAGDRDYYAFFTCGACGVVNRIDWNILPYHIKEKQYQRSRK